MFRRHCSSLFAIAALVVAAWLAWLWQPARQVRRHTERLLAAAESKDWKRLAELMADDYSDRWGHDKAAVLADSREIFRQFFAIEITMHDPVVTESDGRGTASARLTLHGSGSPLAQLAIDRVAELREPFVFTWRLRSGKPWDWVLERVEQPELRID